MAIYAIKLGGSMISKDEDTIVDFKYINAFSEFIRIRIAIGDRFFIVLGGGYMMRKLRDLAKEGGITDDNQLHWIGVTYNNVNAEIVRASMYDICNERIIAYEDFYAEGKIAFEGDRNVIVGGAARAGHSGDMDALLGAMAINADTIISLKNIDGVYTADPKKDPSATKLNNLTWEEYFEIIGHEDKHEPGGNYPIDPVTSKKAKETGKRFIIIDGEDLGNFEKVLNGEGFHGTTVG